LVGGGVLCLTISDDDGTGAPDAKGEKFAVRKRWLLPLSASWLRSHFLFRLIPALVVGGGKMNENKTQKTNTLFWHWRYDVTYAVLRE
jgi:hypothetical protein